MRSSGSWFALVIGLIGLFLLRESRQGALAGWDGAFSEWLAENTPIESRARPEIVLVEINDDSLRIQPEWPWSSLDLALFLKAVRPQNPAAVVLMPALDIADTTGPYTSALEENALKTPGLILPMILGRAANAYERETPASLAFMPNVEGGTSRLEDFSAVKRSPPGALIDTGEQAVLPDFAAGERIRQLPLIVRFRGETCPTIPLLACSKWAKLSNPEVTVRVGDRIVLGEKTAIPIDDQAMMRIDHRTLGRVTRLAYHDLLLAVEQSIRGAAADSPLAAMRNSIVLLGRTDQNAQLHPLPGGRRAATVEILAAAIATIQTRTYVHKSPLWVSFALVAFLAAFGYATHGWPAMRAINLSLVVAALYLLCSLALMRSSNTVLPVAVPGALLALLLVMRIFILRQPRTEGNAPSLP